ncbi:unnamed protein product, partial [Mesorhabditis spiculigera]
MSTEKTSHAEAESFRKLAVFGIALSTAATLTAIIVIPALYNYMQHVQSSLQDDVDFCVHRADSLWGEYAKFEAGHGAQGRLKREAVHRSSGRSSFRRRAVARGAASYSDGGYGGPTDAAISSGGSEGGSCCSCGPGNAGPQGPAGDDGQPGQRGLDGQPGPNGDDGAEGNGGGCDHCPPPRTAPGY